MANYMYYLTAGYVTFLLVKQAGGSHSLQQALKRPLSLARYPPHTLLQNTYIFCISCCHLCLYLHEYYYFHIVCVTLCSPHTYRKISKYRKRILCSLPIIYKKIIV